ncbi:hypothetical protein KEM52_002260 [Ascosphaera acerosa]|nr:hypothetical protein KEM52_002260 [Ascosphaera acerosa]
MKVRAVLPALLTPLSPALFAAVWAELAALRAPYLDMFIEDERQGRLEDADGLPYTLDFLVLEDLDFMQSLLKAPPVRAELETQLRDSSPADSSGWLPQVVATAMSYAQITAEEEGLWDIDVNLFLSEETSVTANYTPRSCAADLVIRLGEWLGELVPRAVLHAARSVFQSPPAAAGWKLHEAALYILNQLLRDLAERDTVLPPELAGQFAEFVAFAIAQHDQPLLRSRGYLVAASLAKVAALTAAAADTSEPDASADHALHFFRRTVDAITADDAEVVQVACLRALQDFLEKLPAALTRPLQPQILSTIADYLATHDLAAMLDSDELKFVLVDALRGAIIVDPATTLSTPALDLLFRVAAGGAPGASFGGAGAGTGSSNFQLDMVVADTFDEIAENIAEQGPEAYAQLCEKVLPSLGAAMAPTTTAAATTGGLTSLAADVLRALTENAPGTLPPGFVAAVMPGLAHVLLHARAEAVLPPATLAVKETLAHDPAQFLAWHDAATGKGAVETTLLIIDRLLGAGVDDAAAAEVGGLAAELVEKAAPQNLLGPFLPQLLSAVARRLATAQQPQIIQNLILVFARLSLASPRDVVDFLAPLTIDERGAAPDGGVPSTSSALQLVLNKWLENSVSFAGYDEIRQNVGALARIYQLEDPRVAQVRVKGDLVVQPADSGRIKTRSQARKNPDTYTVVPAPVKIIKVLVEELSSAAGGNFSAEQAQALAAAGAGEGHDDDDDGDGDGDGDEDDDDWEDVGDGAADGILDLNLGLTKQQLMGLAGEPGGPGGAGMPRTADDETLGFLRGFFADVVRRPGFAEVAAALSAEEQAKLQRYAF